MRIDRRRGWGWVFASLVVSACGGADNPAADPGAVDSADPDRALVLAYRSDLQTLNPIVSTDQNANELIYWLLFTPLVKYDETFEPAPALARQWELDETGVTFDLDPDLTWHDGEPVTADDVAFTFELAKRPETASPLAAAYLPLVEDVEVLDPHRVRFTFSAPHAEPLEDFYWPPVPKHLLEGVAPADVATHRFGREPVGNGPYRFVRWAVGEALEFTAREDHPPSQGGPARIRRVIYRIVPEPTTRLSELMRGDIHLDGAIAPQDLERAGRAEGVDVLSFPWRQFTYIGWNTRRQPFRDARTRRALAMAIDRTQLLQALLAGRGAPAASVIPPWHPYAPDLEPLPFDPEAAAAELEASGWRDSDGDGVRERDGVPLRFELIASQSNPVFGDLVQVVQAQLGAVGVAVEPRLLEWQSVLSRHRGRDFDAVLTNWVLDNFRVDPRPLLHSDQVAVARSANRSSYANPVADSLMDLGTQTLDPGEAARIWQRFAEEIQRDQPLTLLFWNDELAAVRAELRDVHMDARGELITLPRWSWRR